MLRLHLVGVQLHRGADLGYILAHRPESHGVTAAPARGENRRGYHIGDDPELALELSLQVPREALDLLREDAHRLLRLDLEPHPLDEAVHRLQRLQRLLERLHLLRASRIQLCRRHPERYVALWGAGSETAPDSDYL